MSLRSSRVGIIKSRLKSLNVTGRVSYCTKARSVDDLEAVVLVSKRRSNELLELSPNFPFQGGIGFDKKFLKQIQKASPVNEELQTFKFVLQPTIPESLLRHSISEITKILDSQMRILVDPKYEHEDALRVEVMKADRDMELKAVPCPKTIRRDLNSLFVDMEIDKAKEITVLNLTQRSVTDMSVWSEQMEAEREMLIKDFINIASAICHDLQKLGNGQYWADFIEPTSGRPYFGKYTNTTLFETDERYRDLGFQIEDLGCCKVVKHVKWTTHAFIGTIFTNAPLESAELKAILLNSKCGQYFQEKKIITPSE